MYDHIGLKVGDLDASVRFYTAALAPLGIRLVLARRFRRGFWAQGRAGALALFPQGASPCRRACCVPRARPHRDQEISRRRNEGRRPRQWRRRPARRLQPELFCRIPGRSRRQQCRGGVHVGASDPHTLPSFRDAPLGAGPESILPIVVMDSGLARCTRDPE